MTRPILLVEDNPEDAEVMLRALRRTGLEREVLHFRSGDDVLQWLDEVRERPHRLPALILLDLNLPGSDGKEVLRDVRRRLALRTLPIVVVSSSREDRDVRACYRLGIQGYVQKPMHFAELQEVVRALKKMFFDHGVLPPPPRPRRHPGNGSEGRAAAADS